MIEIKGERRNEKLEAGVIHVSFTDLISLLAALATGATEPHGKEMLSTASFETDSWVDSPLLRQTLLAAEIIHRVGDFKE